MQTQMTDEGVSVLRWADPGGGDPLPFLRQRRRAARCASEERSAQDGPSFAGAGLVQPRSAGPPSRGWGRALRPYLDLDEGRGIIGPAHFMARSTP